MMTMQRSLGVVCLVVLAKLGSVTSLVTAATEENTCTSAVLSNLSGLEGLSNTINLTLVRGVVDSVLLDDARCGGTALPGPASPYNRTSLLWLQHPAWHNGLLARWLRGVGEDASLPTAATRYLVEVVSLPSPQGVTNYDAVARYTWSGGSNVGNQDCTVFTADASALPLTSIPDAVEDFRDLPEASCVLSGSPTGPLHPRTFLLLFYRADALEALRAAGLWASSSPPDDWEALLALLQAHAGAVAQQQQQQRRRRRLQQQGSGAAGASAVETSTLPRYGLCLTTSPHCGRAGDVLAAVAASVVQPGGAWQGYAYDLATAPPAADPLINSTGWRYAAGLLQQLLAYNAPANATAAVISPSVTGLPTDCHAVSPLFTSGDCMLTMEWDAVVPILAAAQALREPGVLAAAPLPGSRLVMDRSATGSNANSSSGQAAGLVPCSLALCAPAVNHDFLYGLYGMYDTNSWQAANASAAPVPQLGAVRWPEQLDPSNNVLSAIARVEAAAVEQLLAPGGTPAAATLPSAEQVLARQPLVNRAPYSATYGSVTELNYAGVLQALGDVSAVAILYHAAQLQLLTHRFQRQQATDALRAPFGLPGRRNAGPTSADCDRLVRSPWWLALGPDRDGADGLQAAARAPELLQAEQAARQALEQRGLPAGFARTYLRAVWHALHAPNAAPDLPSAAQPNWHRWSLGHASALLAAGAAPGDSRRRMAAGGEVDGALRLLAATWSEAARAMGPGAVRASYEGAISAPAWSESEHHGHSSRRIQGGALAGLIVGCQVGFVVLLLAVWALVALLPRRSARDVLGRVRAPRVSPDTTLIITDVQNSTVLWEGLSVACMDASLQIHHRTIRHLLAHHGGYESATEGDSFIVALADPASACAFAAACQLALLEQDWPPELLQHPDGCCVLLDARTADLAAGSLGLGSPQEAAAGAAERASYASMLSMPSGAHRTSMGSRFRHSISALMPSGFQRTALQRSRSAQREPPPRHSVSAGAALAMAPQRTSSPTMVAPAPMTLAALRAPLSPWPHERNGAGSPGQEAGAGLGGLAPLPPAGPIWRLSRAVMMRGGEPGSSGGGAMAGVLAGATAELSADDSRGGGGAAAGSSAAAVGAVSWRDTLLALFVEAPEPQAPWKVKPAPTARGKSSVRLPDGRLVAFRGLRVRMGLHSGLSDAKHVAFNKVSSSYQYLGEFAEAARLVSDTACGGMIVLSGSAFTRLRNSVEQATGKRKAARRGGLDEVVVVYAGHHVLKGDAATTAAAAGGTAAATAVHHAQVLPYQSSVQLLPYAPSVPLMPSGLARAARAPEMQVLTMGSLPEREDEANPSGRGGGGSDGAPAHDGSDGGDGDDDGAAGDGGGAAGPPGAAADGSGANGVDPDDLNLALPPQPFSRAVVLSFTRLRPRHRARTSPAAALSLSQRRALTYDLAEHGPPLHAPQPLYQAVPAALACRLALCARLRSPGVTQLPSLDAPTGRITVAFLKVVGAATLLTDLPGPATRALDQCQRLVCGLLGAGGGYLVEAGDGLVLAAFGSPAGAADWALDCVEGLKRVDWEPELLAHELCEEVVSFGARGGLVQVPDPLLGPLASEARSGGGAPRIASRLLTSPTLRRDGTTLSRGLRIKVGLDIGCASHTLTAASGRLSYRGRVMNRAARIAGVAGVGQVLCSGTLWEVACDEVLEAGGAPGGLTSEPLAAVSLGCMALKGIKEPIEIMQCVRDGDC